MQRAAAGIAPAPRVPALAPFQVRSFRFQWPADLATSWAFEMETLILGWYVLVETGSVLLLTLFGSLQFLGTLIAPFFGLGGDRIGPRNMLCMMRAFYACIAATLMTLAFAGLLAPAFVFALAALMGVVRPSDLVMRNALVGEIMPPDRLMGAMSISRTTADSARIAGALAGAGLMASLGIGPAYAAIASLYALSFLLTLGIGRPVRDGAAAAPLSAWRDLVAAGSYVRARPHLLAAMCLAFLVNLAAYPFTNGLLPYVAKEIYRIDQTGLGWLVASFAFGGLIGSITLARQSARIRPARMMIFFAAVWFLLMLAFASMRSAAPGMIVLALAGFMQSLSLVPMSVMLLRGSGAAFRGRVMGLRMLAVYGLPVGLLAAGPAIAQWGFVATASAYALLGLGCTLLILLRWRRHLWPLDAVGNAR